SLDGIHACVYLIPIGKKRGEVELVEEDGLVSAANGEDRAGALRQLLSAKECGKWHKAAGLALRRLESDG
ncbi:MAG: hypothetical protein HY369_04250, partial [Candidatus Aenigmarchaeota archaeon]|nr:hypothetical protein [Candidatus Aenigmarchaeota archaeon]